MMGIEPQYFNDVNNKDFKKLLEKSKEYDKIEDKIQRHGKYGKHLIQVSYLK